MIQNFLLKKMLKSKMRDVPTAEQEKILPMVEKNPQLFQTIAKEAQQKMKEGKDQTMAVMEVMQDHEEELRKLVP